MPSEYKHIKMKILCNDCLAKCTVPFHILKGKCTKCNSYNTTIIEGFIKPDTKATKE